MKINKFFCRVIHIWVELDHREESIDSILENREDEYSWYCPKCDRKYKYSNLTSHTGPR